MCLASPSLLFRHSFALFTVTPRINAQRRSSKTCRYPMRGAALTSCFRAELAAKRDGLVESPKSSNLGEPSSCAFLMLYLYVLSPFCSRQFLASVHLRHSSVFQFWTLLIFVLANVKEIFLDPSGSRRTVLKNARWLRVEVRRLKVWSSSRTASLLLISVSGSVLHRHHFIYFCGMHLMNGESCSSLL